MFVFRHDETEDDKNLGIPAKRLFPNAKFHFLRPELESIHEQEGDCKSMAHLCEASDATELSSFSLNSDDSGSVESEEPALSNVLYKPTFDSPMDHLEQATSPSTPRREAIDLFDKLHAWIVEATDEEIDRYAGEIRIKAIPELLLYIRVNKDDQQRVSEALSLLRRFAMQKDFDALLLIEHHAINVLVLALLSHNTSQFSPANQHSCLFRRIWNFLMDIVLSPSIMDYFREFDPHKVNVELIHYQRMRLVTSVELCLDRAGTAISVSWLGQIFETLTILLRSYDETGTSRPNNDVRLQLWEKKVAIKSLEIMVAQEDFNLFEHDEFSVRALSFFWACLGDESDMLSESVEPTALIAFIRKAALEFPFSAVIQGTGCQILNKLEKRRRIRVGEAAISLPFAGIASNTTDETNDIVQETQVDESGRKKPKEKVSLITLVRAMIPKPCLCDEKALEDQIL